MKQYFQCMNPALIVSFDPAFWLAAASAVATACTAIATAVWLRLRNPRSQPSTIEISTPDGKRVAIAVDPAADSAEIGHKVTELIEESRAKVADHPI